MVGAFKAWMESLTLAVALDWGSVILLIGLALFLTRKTRAVWLVRGYVVLLLLSSITRPLQILHQVFNTLLLGAAVALAVLFQPELRKLLEQLGRGDWFDFLPLPLGAANAQSKRQQDEALDELIEAVRELSQNRIGALIVLEPEQSIDSRIFTDTGVSIQGKLSKELLQTIFQPSTLLHDGAVVVQGDRVKAAGVILPMSERVASRQLGTRHRAAMGITEQSNCLCIVVSEETGSISLAEAGRLERPLTGSRLKDLLTQHWRPQLEVSNGRSSWQGLSSYGRSIWPPRRLLSALRETLTKE
jgi:uncharacterized protein (TIGR00159 family)